MMVEHTHYHYTQILSKYLCILLKYAVLSNVFDLLSDADRFLTLILLMLH